MGTADKDILERAMNELAARGQSMSATGIDEQEMLEVMAHPKASPIVTEILEREEASVGEGDEAPDFALRPLDGPADAPAVRLSDHRGRRPVALVFGSYT